MAVRLTTWDARGVMVHDEIVADESTLGVLPDLLHRVGTEYVAVHRLDGCTQEYRRAPEYPDLELTGEELMREHGVRGVS